MSEDFRKSALEGQNKDNDIFLDNYVSDTYSKKTEDKSQEIMELIEFIRENQPISLWNLSKRTKHSHSKLFYLIRDLEFAGLIHSKIILNKSNRTERMIFCGRSK